MRLSLIPGFALLFPVISAAINLDCSHINPDNAKFDFSPLKGPHSVIWSRKHPPSTINTTYVVDICSPLKKTPGVPKELECKTGTHVCGIEHTILSDGTVNVTGIINIAGNYVLHDGHPTLEPQFTRLKTSSSHADTSKEGVRIELHGGRYPFEGGRNQMAIIEMLCDPNRTGLEDDKHQKRRRDNSDDKDKQDGKDDGNSNSNNDDASFDPERSLRFVSYAPQGKTDVLRLEWSTKYACEDTFTGDPNDADPEGSHWGVFTWFIIIVFLVTAAYLIFGSWLNYNRYGARGWDLVPHSDALRDVPYLMRDWGRSFVGTVSSNARSATGRGGYSAV